MYTFTKEFDGFTHLRSFCKENRCRVSSPSSQSYPARDSWDLGVGYNGAMEIAARGGYWEDGAKLIMEAKSEIDALKACRAVPEEDYDVVGKTIDVAEFVRGTPECWVGHDEEDENHARVIVIGVHVGRAAGTPASEALNRGAAILSYIDDLEAEGHMVELWAIWRNKGGSAIADIRIRIKAAGEPFSAASVAFALAHPATNRRLMWAVAETDRRLDNFCRGYGRGFDRPPEMDVWFPWQESGTWYSKAQSMRLVEREFKRHEQSLEAAA